MTLTLVSTVGTPDANSYVTLDEANAYASTLVFPGLWATASDEQKKAALIQAARLMNSLGWKGQRFDRYQALAWPRCDGYSHRGTAEGYVYDQDGFAIGWSDIPAAVKSAQAEFAIRLIEKDRATDSKPGMQIGSINTPDKPRKLVPSSVFDLLTGLLASMPGCIKAVRG